MPPLPKWVIPFIIGGNIADVASTEWGRQRGLAEMNPAMYNRSVGYPLKAITTTAGIWGAKKLWQDDHKTAAIITAILAGGIPTIAAMHNIKAGRQK